jgi:PAS domain S-box-containing protein
LFNRLSKIDLPRRLSGMAPKPLTQIAVATGVLLFSLALRRIIDALTPGTTAYALMYPAVLAATLIAGWFSGAIVTAVGGIWVWLVVLAPVASGADRTPAQYTSVALYVVSAVAIVGFAEAYRRTARTMLRGQTALAESEARLELATKAAAVGVWEWRPLTQEMIYSDLAKSICGFPAAEPVTYEMASAIVHPEDRPRTSGQAARALDPAIRDNVVYEYRILTPQGEQRWVMANGQAVFEIIDGTPMATRYVGALQDITAAKRAQEERDEAAARMQLLAREVDHRANNLLAVVQGTVQLTHAETPEALKTALIGRLAALARAHQLLSEARWEGADLRRLVEEELLAFSLGEAARVTIEGPDVALPPPAAQALAMALHELATNAAKYGALSAPAGQVRVAWTRAGHGPLRLTWTESGGPLVAPPSRRGLGTTMLARALGGALNGASRTDWRPEGLVCELELPGEALEMASA